MTHLAGRTETERGTGTAEVGQRLTETRGTSSGNPTDYNYFWTRCGRNGGSCSNISGATRATNTVTSADVGDTSCAASAPLQVSRLAQPERLNVAQYTASPSVVGAPPDRSRCASM